MAAAVPFGPGERKRLGADFYDQAYFVGRVKSNYPDYHQLIHSDVVKARAHFIKDFFRPTRTLEIGCAMGFEVNYLRKYGVEAYGVEVSQYAVDNSPERIRPFLYCGDVMELTKKWPKNYFDVVYSYDVLEHIDSRDVPLLMEELQRIGRFNYHRVATEYHAEDRDQSHINLRDIEEWRDSYPDVYLAGSADPDDYALNPPRSQPSIQLIQFLNQHPYGN